MTELLSVSVTGTDTDAIAEMTGTLAIFVTDEGALDQLGKRVNRLAKGVVERWCASDAFAKVSDGDGVVFSFPSSLAADRIVAVKLAKKARKGAARKAGATVARLMAGDKVALLVGTRGCGADIAYGFQLRAYAFRDHKTDEDTPAEPTSAVLMVNKPEEVEAALKPLSEIAAGVFFARDLTNEPANVLTTTAFAERLEALSTLGLKVEVLDEAAMEKLGMRALLGVGQGSETPSYLVILRWDGGEKGEKPLVVVGKGVVFDTGGISLKPPGGMEDMTADMGGAGVVAGVMRAIAGRKAAANVIGVVGLVENMPDGRAQRPGDIVRSMKGDTIEIINTDAEGRLVLADALWYAQEHLDPAGIIDLATLTGAAIIALGHENAAVFGTDDDFTQAFLAAARMEEEGAWRMPLGSGYARQIKSAKADVKNTGGRPAGTITAAEFLHRFVRDEMPWIHLDIAGVATRGMNTDLAPKGATGWGVRAIDRLIADQYET